MKRRRRKTRTRWSEAVGDFLCIFKRQCESHLAHSPSLNNQSMNWPKQQRPIPIRSLKNDPAARENTPLASKSQKRAIRQEQGLTEQEEKEETRQLRSALCEAIDEN